ncbi:MAG: glutamine--fructose-6-phosphate transaminase (isomerizing) [Ruminococcaceae bacterium]|nr:glutamine--fructose-6-phosphate transaminase (isomerizing) [Oscillospiraceae bacterium]
MCGIIGYTGTKNSVPFLLQGLRALEYRGYDSAGVAVQINGGINTVKAKGRIDNLEEKINSSEIKTDGTCGIGHTRWATHGAPSDINSHPHRAPSLALIHNGIIENYAEIEEMLSAEGYTFVSETDTEAAAKLIDYYFVRLGDPVKAIFEATDVIRGSYAFGVIFDSYPDTIYSIRKDSPLIVASTEEGGFIASDIPAILSHTSSYYQLEEGIVAIIGKNNVSFVDRKGNESSQTRLTIDWNVEQAQKGGFPHFMIKEIHEEPEAIRKTVSTRIGEDGLPDFGIRELDIVRLSKFKNIHIVACGTAMHAGLIGKNIIEKIARVPVNVDIASEFRYRDPILSKDDLVILLSQSGETADTLAALRHAKSKGVYTLSIVNVIGSSVAREADSVLYTWAGPEISVASTKAYSVQCALLYLFAVQLARACGKLSDAFAKELCRKLTEEVPEAISKTLELSKEIKNASRHYLASEHLFFIGRGIDSALCSEASLKLKEISYIHCEAYAAGELKHGTISLITDGIPVVALMTEEFLAEKVISGIREVKSRGANVLAITTKEIAEKYAIPADKIISVPEVDEFFAPFLLATVVQLFAYHIAAGRGCDVDKPRNLAKSVTVE